jgi:hypothetical protein
MALGLLGTSQIGIIDVNIVNNLTAFLENGRTGA